MKRFVVKILALIVVFPFAYLAVYMSIDFFINRESADNSLFVWGDSQTYRGINLPKLKKETGLNVYSSAKPGAGVYDFLVFVDKVPRNSKVLISISELILLRRKDRDNNKSDIALSAIKPLLENNYSLIETIKIFYRNRKLSKLFQTQTSLYLATDSITITDEEIQGFKLRFHLKPKYFNDKINIIRYGLKKLQEKNCKILLVKFPYYPAMQEIKEESVLNDEINNQYRNLIANIAFAQIDTIYLNKDLLIMHDYTHLNASGANIVTDSVSNIIMNNKNLGIVSIFLQEK